MTYCLTILELSSDALSRSSGDGETKRTADKTRRGERHARATRIPIRLIATVYSRVTVSPMTRMAPLTKAFALVVPAAACVVAGSAPDGGESGSTPCAQMGGLCQNGTCYNVGGTAYEYRGSIQGLCGSNPPALCCIRPDVNGGLPPQLGSAGICGRIVCDSGSTCNRGVDAEGCTNACDVSSVLDAGCASCGSISCDVGCTCLDAARNHCGC